MASSTVSTGRVVHSKRSPYDVYIGRPSKWGNPFVVGVDGDRATVIAQYRDWVLRQPELMAALPELRGKVLGCWCSPQACHGDVLVELANQERNAWWRKHPAYDDLLAIFKDAHINNGGHLAYVMLTGLKAKGWDFADLTAAELSKYQGQCGCQRGCCEMHGEE